MATLRLEIVTPEEKIYSEDVDMVTLPGSEGELGVYPKHVPLLTTLTPGELRVLKNGRETAMASSSRTCESSDERRSNPGTSGRHSSVIAESACPVTRQAPAALRLTIVEAVAAATACIY